VRFLLDTSIFLEILLAQARSEEARELMENTEEHIFFTTDFAVHSIGCKLFERRQHDQFLAFLNETVINGAVDTLSLGLDDMGRLAEASRMFALDFDDAYQYAAAEENGLTIVSFDSDFDRTERGRKTPADLLTT
jgi:predicted nucleic acid-binding protein